MIETFINLPEKVSEAITTILSSARYSDWLVHAQNLHTRYMNREKGKNANFVEESQDAAAYLGLRVPATYAQIYSALLQIQESIPSWEPTSLLDVGCGPGTGMWTAKSIWPSITEVVNVDQEKDFLSLGKQIAEMTDLSVSVTWLQQNIRSLKRKHDESYDLIIVANVLNELEQKEGVKVLKEIYAKCTGVMIVLEPGTSYGYAIIQKVAKDFSKAENLISPYVANSFVRSDEYWIHFSQRFIRPLFQRHIRQKMRESDLMASNWEETKYAYVAIGKMESEKTVWGRCIGEVKKYKGYLEVPILTKDEIVHKKILKRNKKEYAFVKKLEWGEIIVAKRVTEVESENIL